MKIYKMKNFLFLFTLLLQFNLLSAQYYYRDLVAPVATSQQLQQYREQKVKSVQVSSFEGNGAPAEGFSVQQTINPAYTQITTLTKSSLAGESQLKTFYDNSGRVLRTIDTTDGSSSTSEYTYNQSGQVTTITNTSVSAGQSREKEVHLWYYNADGKPERMIKIKNNIDTTFISFVIDDKGNIAEETSVRKGKALPGFYYYYDDKNRITDIVRYNTRVKKLLPDYMFEYNNQGQLRSMIIVPEGSDDYQRWVYQYDETGLKIKETCLNKRKQVIGRVEYSYKR